MPAVRLAPDVRLQEEILVHMLGRINLATVEADPFPHFFVEGVFPEHIYQQLLSVLPDTQQYISMGERHHNGDGTYNRMVWPMVAQWMDPLPQGPQRDLLHGLQRALLSRQLKKLVYSKLADGIGYRFGIDPADVDSIPGYPHVDLMRETQGYYIAPHPDTRNKIVTMQFALPADCSQEDLGTALYERSLAPADWLTVPRGFRKAKQFPFRPNCAYAFAVLNGMGKKSWHGRELIEGACRERNSILHVYRSSPWKAVGYD